MSWWYQILQTMADTRGSEVLLFSLAPDVHQGHSSSHLFLLPILLEVRLNYLNAGGMIF